MNEIADPQEDALFFKLKMKPASDAELLIAANPEYFDHR